MQILILQGSPRAKGNTAWMAEEYKNAAEAAGHAVIDLATAAQILATSTIPGFYEAMCGMI